MAIELKLKKDDEYKTYKRPDTNVLDVEEFEEMQVEIGKIHEEYVVRITEYQEKIKGYKGGDEKMPRPEAISYYPYKKRIRDRQIEHIVGLFEEYDPFTVKEFKLGVSSDKLDDTIVEIFRKLSPSDYKEDDEGKSEKNSRSKSSKRT